MTIWGIRRSCERPKLILQPGGPATITIFKQVSSIFPLTLQGFSSLRNQLLAGSTRLLLTRVSHPGRKEARKVNKWSSSAIEISFLAFSLGGNRARAECDDFNVRDLKRSSHSAFFFAR